MSNRTLGRIAVGAAATLVAGMLPVVMLAGTAAAAAPTTLTVTPSTQTIAGSGNAQYTIGFNNDVPPGGIYYAVASGPDGASAPFSAALPCTTMTNNAICTVVPGGTAGTDDLVFFYSPTAGTTPAER